MSLTVYMRKKDIPDGVGIINNNDVYFESIKDLLNVDDTVLHMLDSIDQSVYRGGTTILTRYGEVLDMTYSSTGCKTAINIGNSNGKIVNCIEAGNNAVKEILKLKVGTILLELAPYIPDDFEIDCKLIDGNKELKITSARKLSEMLQHIGGR